MINSKLHFFALSALFVSNAAFAQSVINPNFDAGAPLPLAKPSGFVPFDETQIGAASTLTVDGAKGADSNAGSVKAPLKTIGAALSKAAPRLAKGEAMKISVRPGVYREVTVEINGAKMGGKARPTPLIIEGTDKATVMISGATLYPIATWKAVRDSTGKIDYYEHPWDLDFGNSSGNHGIANGRKIIAHRSEMMRINGQHVPQMLLERYDYDPLAVAGQPDVAKATGLNQYVGEGVYSYRGFVAPSQLPAGTFGVAERDENGNKIFYKPLPGQDLSKAIIEVSERRRQLNLAQKDNVILRNLTFTGSPDNVNNNGKSLQIGGGMSSSAREVSFYNRNVLLQNIDVIGNGGTGLFLGGSYGVTLDQVRCNTNGAGGAAMQYCQNVVFRNVETSFNNWRGRQGGVVSWHMGGIKIVRTRDLLVQDYQAIANFCPGFWLDIDNRNITVERGVFLENTRGFFYEISPGAVSISDSVIAGNAVANLHTNTSGPLTVERSIVLAMPARVLRLFPRGGKSEAIGAISIAESGRGKNVIKPMSWEIERGADPTKSYSIASGPLRLSDSLVAAKGEDSFLILGADTGWREKYQAYFGADYVGQNNRFASDHTAAFALDVGWQKPPLPSFLETGGFGKWTNFARETGSTFGALPFHDAANYDLRPTNPNQVWPYPKFALSAAQLNEIDRFQAWTKSLGDGEFGSGAQANIVSDEAPVVTDEA